MSQRHLTTAQVICRPLPPPVAGVLGKRIYPLTEGRRDKLRFVRRSQTGSYFAGTTADFNAHQFAIRGHNDWRNWGIAKALAAPGDTIIEVGANVGTETVGFSDVVGATGRVFAFEPLPDCLTALDQTVPLMRHANVEVLPVALGAEHGTQEFAAPPPTARSQGTGHLLGPDEAERGKVTYRNEDVDWPVIEIECTTLDSLADRLGPARIIFIDAEGAEVGILEGGEQFIRRNTPALVLEACSDHLVRLGTSINDLHATLAGLGYRSFAISRLRLEPLIAPDETTAPGNWLCLPESQVSDAHRLERFLLRCALTPRIARLNPLSGAGS